MRADEHGKSQHKNCHGSSGAAVEAMAQPEARRSSSGQRCSGPRRLGLTAFVLVCNYACRQPARTGQKRGKRGMRKLTLALWDLTFGILSAAAQDWPTRDHADHRAVRPRLHSGHRRPGDRRQHAAEARRVVRDREPSWRQRQYRDRSGREGGAGRLHHRHQPGRPAGHQHAVVREDAVRPRQGTRADHHARDPAERAGGECEPGRQLGRRTIAC